MMFGDSMSFGISRVDSGLGMFAAPGGICSQDSQLGKSSRNSGQTNPSCQACEQVLIFFRLRVYGKCDCCFVNSIVSPDEIVFELARVFFWFRGSSGKFFEEKFYSTIKSFDVCENLEAGERFVLLE